MKKKLGTKLASGVRQVKSQRDAKFVSTPDKLSPKQEPVEEQTARPTQQAVATKPINQCAEKQSATSLNKLHPRRVWPD